MLQQIYNDKCVLSFRREIKKSVKLNNCLNEMKGLMKEVFSELNLITTATQQVPLKNPSGTINPTVETRGIQNISYNLLAMLMQRQEPSGEVTLYTH